MRVTRGLLQRPGGQTVAYTTIGHGPTIFCCNGLGVPVYFWRHLTSAFASTHQIICWDYRGHGQSPTPAHPERLSFHDLIDDGIALLEHLDIACAVGVGHSAGFQILLSIYEKSRARFTALASFLGTPGHPLSSFLDSKNSRLGFDALYVLMAYFPHQMGIFIDLLGTSYFAYYLAGYLGLIDLREGARKEVQVYIDHVRKMDPVLFVTMMQAAEHHDASAVLPTIDVPTLLIAAEHDLFVPLRLAHEMADTIPNADLHIIAEGSHAALFERPQDFNQPLAQFLELQGLSPKMLTHRPARRRK